MLDFIKAWTISIGGAVIVASFTELLIPNCSAKKYINFTMGLIIITIIISPIKNITGSDLKELSSIINGYTYSADNINDGILSQFNLKSIFEKKLSKKLDGMIKEKFPESDIYTMAETNFDTNTNQYKEIKNINVFISAQNQSDYTENIKQQVNYLLSSELGIPESKIIFWSDTHGTQ